MLARIRNLLTKSSALKVGEHLALAFGSAFALAAVATTEHAASTHGFSLSWSFLAGVGSSALTGGYQAIRPQLAALAARLLGKTAAAAAATPAATKNTTTTSKP